MLAQIDKLNRHTAQLQARAARMDKNANTADESDGFLLLMEFESALDKIKTLQTHLSYMFRPIKESSRLWKNGSGQYETIQGHCFREGSPIEILVPDKFGTGRSYWLRTYTIF